MNLCDIIPNVTSKLTYFGKMKNLKNRDTSAHEKCYRKCNFLNDASIFAVLCGSDAFNHKQRVHVSDRAWNSNVCVSPGKCANA